MAPARSKRQSRKRRRPGQAVRPAGVQAPRGAPAARPAGRSDRPSLAAREAQRTQSSLGTYGERPPNPFGGVPVSELAILIGAIGAAVGFFAHQPSALAVGIVVCALGVIEVTAREHFSGYRSHATLLAGIPAIALGIGLVAAIGHGSVHRGLSGPNRSILLVIVPVFALCFWLLRKRFRAARQARVIRPPVP